MDRPSPIIEILNNCIHYASEIFIQMGDKSNYGKQLILWLGALTAYLLGSNNYEMLIVLLVLVVLDWITGIRAAFKTGKKIKSAGIGRTSEKIVGYFCLIVVAKLTGKITTIADLEKIAVAFYIAKEAYSIIENVKKMGIPVPAIFEKAIENKIQESEKELDKKED